MEFVLVVFNTDRSLSLINYVDMYFHYLFKNIYMGSFLLIVFLIAAYCEAPQPIMDVAL